MCGIVAVLSHAAPLDHQFVGKLIPRALDALAHRGPDGQGIWQSPHRRVVLGHRRLALRDSLGGAQPLSNYDTSVVATVNGELYGANQLRATLSQSGHRLIHTDHLHPAFGEWQTQASNAAALIEYAHTGTKVQVVDEKLQITRGGCRIPFEQLIG